MRSQWVGWSQNRAYHRSQAVQWPFILYGDSLTEVWKGTQGCRPYSQRSGFDALRQLYLSPLSNADGMSGGSDDLRLCHVPEPVVAIKTAVHVDLVRCEDTRSG